MNIANLARNVGFTGTDLTTAIAIAYAESSGNCDAYYPETDYFTAHGIPPDKAQGMGSYGLFQVFLYVHPEFLGWNLKDGQTNACAARLIYQKAGYSFKPWSSYLGKVYLAHLDQAQKDISCLEV